MYIDKKRNNSTEINKHKNIAYKTEQFNKVNKNSITTQVKLINKKRKVKQM